MKVIETLGDLPLDAELKAGRIVALARWGNGSEAEDYRRFEGCG